jgi:hypothetical protein
MSRSILSIAKDILRRDPIPAMNRKLESFYRDHQLTPKQKEWVEEHRKKHDAEEEALALKYVKAELEYLKTHVQIS